MITRGLSFDLGKKATGVVRWENDFPATQSIWTFDHCDTIPQVLTEFNIKLRLELDPGYPDWVAVERAKPRFIHWQEIYWGMMGILSERCYFYGITMQHVMEKQAKLALTGHGGASKEAMLNTAVNTYPHLAIQQADSADAVGVGLAFLEKVEWREVNE